MINRLEDDLTAWEAGLLSEAELETRHPSEDVTALTGLHMHLSSLGREAAPDPDSSWRQLRSRLPERPLRMSERLGGWLRRPVLAGVAAGLMSTGVAYAGDLPPVRAVVDQVRSSVAAMLESTDPSATDARHEHEAAARSRGADAGPLRHESVPRSERSTVARSGAHEERAALVDDDPRPGPSDDQSPGPSPTGGDESEGSDDRSGSNRGSDDDRDGSGDHSGSDGDEGDEDDGPEDDGPEDDGPEDDGPEDSEPLDDASEDASGPGSGDDSERDAEDSGRDAG